MQKSSQESSQKSTQISNNIMTPHEFSKICGIRATHLMNGQVARVKLDGQVNDIMQIVYEEIKQKKIPTKLVRYLPGGGEETVDPNKLYIDDSFFN